MRTMASRGLRPLENGRLGQHDPTRVSRAYVAGQWCDADTGETDDVLDPASGTRVGVVPHCGAREAIRAIHGAAEAQGRWAAEPPKSRGRHLLRLADAVRSESEDLARLICLEQGKPLHEARAEMAIAADYIHWFAEEAPRLYGDVVPSPWVGRKLLVEHMPVGVVAAITPWNFPSSMIARKLGPALATGCTIVIKPAPQTPLSALAWGQLCDTVDLPPGLVSIVPGDARAIGDAFIDSPEVAKLSFTGSTAVGRHLAGRCGEKLKRVSMELGGNAPFLVFNDADLDAAVDAAMAAKFRNSGQTCICVNRFYAQSGIHDAFASRLSQRAEALTVGPGLEDGVEQGPLIEPRAVRKVQDHFDDARERGATVLAGGAPHHFGGNFVSPTVLTGLSATMRITSEETFGPLAAIGSFENEEEAMKLANSGRGGLAAYVFTRDLGRALRLSGAVNTGIVGVNAGIITAEGAPFGGTGDSGFGREGGRQGWHDFTDIKYTCIGGM